MGSGIEHPDNLWRPTASLEVMQIRAEMLSRLRQYFATEGVLEVETPLMASGTIPDPHIPSFSIEAGVVNPSDENRRYLNTSPEFAMKRLLAAGYGSIYQVCKAFRQGERGRMHNPEFTLLEWYRLDFEHHRLMDDVTALVARLADGYRDFKPEERLSYQEAFQYYLGLDPFLDDIQKFISCAHEQGIGSVPGLAGDDRDGWLDLLMSQCIQTQLGKDRLTFIYDYPASQAALARLRPGNPPVAERFELFIDGVELANGFHELRDADEQRDRFRQDLASRQVMGLEPVAQDELFLASLESGLPECSGVALGLDRLLLVLTGESDLNKVMVFPFSRI